MLLFSTILDINENVTREDFLNLVIEWNQSHDYHPENEVTGVEWNKWNEEGSISYICYDIENNLQLSLEKEEFSNERIIAVRHKKIEGNGTVWYTDYVMNFKEKRLAIQLDRSYEEGVSVTDGNFSTPHIITMLIGKGYLKDDGKLPIWREPFTITEENLEILTDRINGKRKYRLPIVYVSKTMDASDPVDIGLLARRLKGAAHVLVHDNRQVEFAVRRACPDDENEYNGSITVYYPNESAGCKRFLYRRHKGADDKLLKKVVKEVIRRLCFRSIDDLYTWQGVRNALLSDRLKNANRELGEAEDALKKAEIENLKVYDTVEELEQRIQELVGANDVLRYENEGIRANASRMDSLPLLYMGDEEDYYDGEIKDIVLSTLEKELKKMDKDEALREVEVLTNIISTNDYQCLGEHRREKIDNLFKGYRTLTTEMRQELLELGFEITSESNHYKLTYKEDTRYCITISKTSSDFRAGKNAASTIGNIAGFKA